MTRYVKPGPSQRLARPFATPTLGMPGGRVHPGRAGRSSCRAFLRRLRGHLPGRTAPRPGVGDHADRLRSPPGRRHRQRSGRQPAVRSGDRAAAVAAAPGRRPPASHELRVHPGCADPRPVRRRPARDDLPQSHRVGRRPAERTETDRLTDLGVPAVVRSMALRTSVGSRVLSRTTAASRAFGSPASTVATRQWSSKLVSRLGSRQASNITPQSDSMSYQRATSNENPADSFGVSQSAPRPDIDRPASWTDGGGVSDSVLRKIYDDTCLGPRVISTVTAARRRR